MKHPIAALLIAIYSVICIVAVTVIDDRRESVENAQPNKP